jgi:hypothetical protein
MTDENEIDEEGRQARFEKWEQLGLDRIKHDLLNGGHSLVGGRPAVRRLAWEWVRMKESASKPDSKEILTLKPTLWGVGIDLKELGRRFLRLWQGKSS